MVPRNTGSGRVMEQMISAALKTGGYKVRQNVTIGQRFGVARHRVDAVAANDEGKKFVISLKWQQVQGTAEQKIPFEVMCLIQAMKDSEEFDGAYLVLGGDGWSYRDFFLSGGLNKWFVDIDMVKIVSLEAFVGLANQKKL